jgi:hypothetical protein
VKTRLGLLLLVLMGGVLVATEGPDPRSLLEQSITFHGGKAALQSLPHVKGTGTIELAGRTAGRARDYVEYQRADGGRRSETSFEFRGRQITAVEIYDGKMCKRSTGGGWDDLPLDENRERAAHRIDLLLRALSASPTLAGEADELGVAAWRVAMDDGAGGKAVLSLAKDDARLLAIEYPATEAEGMGTKKAVTRKVLHHALLRVGNVQLPSDVEVLRDGSFESRMRFERLEPLPRWEEDWLRVPDPRRRFIPSEELAY